jgi:hypothetical protein
MFRRYRHEADIYPSLGRIPLHVRMKLDLTGIKISLKDWLAFSFEERTVLCHLPIDTEEEKRAYSAYLDFLSRQYHGAPAATTAAMSSSLWDVSDRVPTAVAERSAARSAPVKVEEWRSWDYDQRYALYKTAISKSDPEQFSVLLEELRDLKL